MRKKFVSKTYLRDVNKHIFYFYYDSTSDYYVSIKKIIECTPFIITSGLKLIDNGYYIIEITPLHENYNIRIYLDKEKNILQYYIDISSENGLDKDSKIPYYTDLYTDITITNGVIEVLDIDELISAHQNKQITEETFNLAEKTKEKLITEIQSGCNKYLNIDVKKYLI